jgi:hypothetical protein
LAAACHFVASLPDYPHSRNIVQPPLIEYDVGDNVKVGAAQRLSYAKASRFSPGIPSIISSSSQRRSTFVQHGPGTENAYGGVAQAFGDSIPILVVPGGYPRPGWVSETHPNEQV